MTSYAKWKEGKNIHKNKPFSKEWCLKPYDTNIVVEIVSLCSSSHKVLVIKSIIAAFSMYLIKHKSYVTFVKSSFIILNLIIWKLSIILLVNTWNYMHVRIIINASPFTSSFTLAMHNYVWHLKKNSFHHDTVVFWRSTKYLFLIILLVIVFLTKFINWEEADGNEKYTSGSLFNWYLKLFFFLLQENLYFTYFTSKRQKTKTKNVLFCILWYFHTNFSFESHKYSGCK